MSTYFLYLLLVVLLGNVLDIPAASLCNFRFLGRFLQSFVFRLFDLLGLVHSLGHPDDVHCAVTVGDHYLDSFSLDVLVEIARIDCQVKIVLAAYVIDRGTLIVWHAYAVLVRRGTETAIGAVVERIIAVVPQELIIGAELSGSELLAVRFVVSGITIGVTLRGGNRRAAVARGRFDLERFLVILEIIERGAVSTAASITITAEAATTE